MPPSADGAVDDPCGPSRAAQLDQIFMNSHNLGQGPGAAAAGSPTASALPERPYSVSYVDAAPDALDEHVLACVGHGVAIDGADPRRIQVELPLLQGPAFEVWRSPQPVTHGWDHGIGYAESASVLMGQMRVPDAELAHTDRAVFHAYAIIDGFLRRRGFPAWLRVWNYVGHINEGVDDAERYRQFTLGRHKALSLKSGFEHELPAATAIGTHGGGMLMYFLAGRASGVQVENPRQVSAFRYPREYGPRSPSFSRAMLLPWSGGAELMVSGTASIVGHQTLHVGEPLRQLDEALRNVEALQTQAAPGGAWRAQAMKVYVRNPADAPAAAERLRQWSGAPVVALHGDICRRDLAIEIEGAFLDAQGCASAAGAGRAGAAKA
jgi:chorismate lyase/3-hydroxybenzoate synthase